MIDNFQHTDIQHQIKVDTTNTGLVLLSIQDSKNTTSMYITSKKAKELGEALILIANEIK
tara:strand:+ start:1299 stop:1478 length:180 start_codon:yes stop_codon:yes gene_type:complete